MAKGSGDTLPATTQEAVEEALAAAANMASAQAFGDVEAIEWVGEIYISRRISACVHFGGPAKKYAAELGLVWWIGFASTRARGTRSSHVGYQNIYRWEEGVHPEVLKRLLQV
eukprot:CAMPEP_0181238614 /NCGR_PEP_ID=MMETSP1096-20121128/39453_1 /TAXON_ID=156174 ORGANISM="Chrysochromulina ericina, Strain CCMP281" /NCGR_SAMPLE_ID=MMETSP1096 /ASSEMBLY_ACC=CAM_ASM_000453 /LENGTH=112 /DNA_ID=CAMNT_0023334173 /DNA_START=216 /DNA_END=555 /DNA_ORIENTATION=-